MSQSLVEDLTLTLKMMQGEVVSIAPPHAMGWTHVWDAVGTQLRMSDEQAAALAFAGMIYYSRGNGPNAKVYRLCEGISIDMVREAIGE